MEELTWEFQRANAAEIRESEEETQSTNQPTTLFLLGFLFEPARMFLGLGRTPKTFKTKKDISAG